MKPRSFSLFSLSWFAFAWAVLLSFQTNGFAQAPASPAEEAAPVAPASPDPDGQEHEKVASTADTQVVEPAPPVPPPVVESKKEPVRPGVGVNRHRRHSNDARVSIMHDSTLERGGEADAVVSIFGSSTSEGTVHDAVVSILGSSTSSGDVGDAVVSVLGNTRVTGGTVGDSAVAVFGNNYVNGHIRGEVVAVFGNVELGPDAVVDGDVVCVGGELHRDPNAVVHGAIRSVIPIGGQPFAFDGLSAWISQCLALGRPLAFGPHLLWAWWIALTCLGLYAFIALIAPGAALQCVGTLETRPGKSILAALLVMLLTPVIFVLLAFTVFIVVGVALIPLFTLGLFFAGIFGRLVMLAWLGRRIAKLFHAGETLHVAATVLIGGMIVLGLYTVPVLGFLAYKLLGILGLGVVVYTLLLSIRSNRPVPVAPRPAPVAAPLTPTFTPPVAPDYSATSPVLPANVPLSPAISSATLPRAGFWIRFAAAILDAIMVGILFGVLNGMLGWLLKATGSFPFWFAVYHVVMWATKGTTIGGIVCGLKVVRLDDRPIDWGVAIVR